MSTPALASSRFAANLPRTVSSKQHPLVALLRRYADHLGDFREPLLEAAQKVQWIASANDTTQRQLVIDAIEVGCNALGDLTEETHLAEPTVQRIWAELIEDGEYEERPIGLKTDMARGRRLIGIFKKTATAGNLPSSSSRHHYQNSEPEFDDL